MSTTPERAGSRELRERLNDLTIEDAHRLGRRLERLRGAHNTRARERFEATVAEAEARVSARRAAVPTPIDYPAELPVSARRDDLLRTIRDNQVVVVAGETGSGKSTQLPKLCLELGRGVRGTIAHTQPRRLAARTIAERVAEELDVPLGGPVGYAVRFADRSSDETLVRLMTDGLLLAEIQHDRLLRRYDTIVVDEAHERSLNIDFLLGCLKRILPRRPELKLLITSATIDVERLSEHFDGAPVVEVSGRTYPVETRYRPVPDAEHERLDAIPDAVQELLRDGPGDVLVFLSGEREIRDTAELLSGRLRSDVEILPLYARLSHAEQQKVFQQPLAPARRARDERRGDVADGAGDRQRRRPGRGAHLALLRAAEGAAAADRADLAGQRRPAQGPLRAHLRRHLHPPLRRRRLRRAPSLHRPRGPAHEPRGGDPADGGAGAGRGRGVPVPRPARRAPGARRRRAAARAGGAGAGRERPREPFDARSAASSRSCRSTRGSDGWCWRATSSAARRRRS